MNKYVSYLVCATIGLAVGWSLSHYLTLQFSESKYEEEISRNFAQIDSLNKEIAHHKLKLDSLFVQSLQFDKIIEELTEKSTTSRIVYINNVKTIKEQSIENDVQFFQSKLDSFLLKLY